VQSPAEVSVARGGQGAAQVERRGVPVASGSSSHTRIATSAGEECGGGDEVLLKHQGAHGGFEGRARGIGAHDGTVEERLALL